jgi:hypothetical protein
MSGQRTATLDPGAIMQIGFGFWPAKTLLSAVELGLFTLLADGSLSAAQIADRLEFQSRATYDFLDSLVSLHMLERDGSGPEARYANTAETGAFLDAKSPTYIGGVLEFANTRFYPFWGGLTEALQTGQPQNEVKHTGRSIFEDLCADPERLEQFMRALDGIGAGTFAALAQKFDFSRYGTVCDAGGATGLLSTILAQHHPHLRCTTFDLPAVEPIARRTVAAAKLTDRVDVAAGNFFADPLPRADVVTMSMILHDWDLDKKKQLIQAAYDALPEGGAFIAIENLIDDDRRTNVFGLMMSLNMLIETGDGFDYTGEDFRGWCQEIGFRRVEILPLAGPASAALAYR